MADADYEDDESVVDDLVDDAIVADADAVENIVGFHLDIAVRAGIFGKAVDGRRRFGVGCFLAAVEDHVGPNA